MDFGKIIKQNTRLKDENPLGPYSNFEKGG